MAVKIQVKVFWFVMSCSVFTLKTVAARSSNMLVSYCNGIWHCDLEDDLNTCFCPLLNVIATKINKLLMNNHSVVIVCAQMT